jgi:myo-inositol-1(or 4)-monophosphatase
MLTFSDFISFVEEVTTITSVSINNFFDSNIGSSRFKDDGSIVTDADIIAEKFIRDQVGAKFKKHDIIGEELCDKSLKSDSKWIIDPIDGTYNFAKGVPMFGTLIGFLYEEQPTYGSLRLPKFQNDFIVGDNNECLYNGVKLKTSIFRGWNNALILTTDEVRIFNSKISKQWQKLKTSGANFRSWGDCFGYFLVCQGKADAMFDLDLKPYDILPLIPILKGAGVAIIDLSEEQNFSSIIACKPEIKDKMLQEFIL